MALIFTTLSFIIALMLLMPLIMLTMAVTLTLGWVLIYRNLRKVVARPNLSGLLYWIKAIIIEYAISIVTGYIRVFFHLFGKTAAITVFPSDTAIVLVHGFGDTPWTWWWFKKQLKLKTNIPIYTINLYPSTRPIEQLAEQLKADIELICSKSETVKFHLIGHSMGGLVSAYYREFLAQEIGIESVTLLASPVQGTKTAQLGFGDSVTQMQYQHPFSQDLSQRMGSRIACYRYIASVCDNVIVPWQSACAPSEKSSCFVIGDKGHLSLLYDKAVVKNIVADLPRR